MKMTNVLFLAMAAGLPLSLSGCVSGTLLATHTLAGHEPAKGGYTLILQGGQSARDLRTVAILDRDDDPYTIMPFGAAFNYRVVGRLPAGEAMATGERFLNDLISYRSMARREILGPDRTVIGYELRPLFMPFATGLSGDPLQTSYLLRADGQVTVYVDLKRPFHTLMDADDHGMYWGQ